jgi:hypothetical protein
MGASRIGIRHGIILVADRMNDGTVHLIEPVKGAGDPGYLLQAGTIGLDPRWRVPHMGAQIETGEHPFTLAAIPGGRQGSDASRGWPVGFDPFHLWLLSFI